MLFFEAISVLTQVEHSLSRAVIFIFISLDRINQTG